MESATKYRPEVGMNSDEYGSKDIADAHTDLAEPISRPDRIITTGSFDVILRYSDGALGHAVKR